MSASAKQALIDAVDNAYGGNDEAELMALINAINNAKASISMYEQIRSALDLIGAVGEIDTNDMETAYSEGTFEDIDEVYAMYQKANIDLLTPEPGTDYTTAIINPSFEFNGGSTFGWTYEPSGDHGAKPKGEEGSTYYVDNADGDYVFNIWSSGNPVSQTITGLPNGVYELTATIATDADHHVILFGNDDELYVEASSAGKGFGVDGTLDVTVSNGMLTIGAEGENAYWYKVDNFRLIFKEAPTQVVGDANLDDKIDVRDMATILDAILNGTTDELPAVADVNGDGKIDVRDMAALLNKILGNE
jgi:hypothetical protein